VSRLVAVVVCSVLAKRPDRLVASQLCLCAERRLLPPPPPPVALCNHELCKQTCLPASRGRSDVQGTSSSSGGGGKASSSSASKPARERAGKARTKQIRQLPALAGSVRTEPPRQRRRQSLPPLSSIHFHKACAANTCCRCRRSCRLPLPPVSVCLHLLAFFFAHSFFARPLLFLRFGSSNWTKLGTASRLAVAAARQQPARRQPNECQRRTQHSFGGGGGCCVLFICRPLESLKAANKCES
jgi:hypothetical protein